MAMRGWKLPDSLPAKALSIGVVTMLVGTLISASPFGWKLEEDLGLAWLFTWRGPRSAPSEVVVVTTDRKSAHDLGVPQEPWKWPRSFHSRLIHTLTDQGAKVIAFDLFFKEAGQSDAHQTFARTIREAGNVVLIEKMTTWRNGDTSSGVDMHMRIRPHEDFAQSAAALAPNPLPGIPFRVNQFWLFEPSETHAATLPFIVFQVFARDAYPDFLTLLNKFTPERAQALPLNAHDWHQNSGIQSMTHVLRDMFHMEASFATDLLAELEQIERKFQDGRRKTLKALIKAFSHGDSQYLDFYGPPRTITTIPYSCVLDACGQTGQVTASEAPFNFAGKAVFVGLSEAVEAEQTDRFHTVFTSEDGFYISGVEIAATGFANLLEDRRIVPLALWLHLLIVAVWGMLIGVVFRIFPPARFRTGPAFAVMLVGAGIGAGAMYFGIAAFVFSSAGLWLPLVVPLLLQLPVGIVVNSFSRYLDAHREQQNTQKALEHYVPRPIANQIAKNLEEIKSKGQLLEGICLETDAEHYTALAESSDPQELRDLMNRYYEVVFEPVRTREGHVSNVIGDSVLAIWTGSQLDRELRTNVCEAALHIAANVARFNERHGRVSLPTRIGIHGGRMCLGHVGAGDHYEYRAVGDMVNTATRIEALNKYLGTRILASHIIIEDLEGFLTRDVGTFRLKGKSQAMKIYEILGKFDEAEAAKREEIAVFAEAMEAFRAERWREAMAGFQKSLSLNSHDGPSRYYVQLCETYLRGTSPYSRNGVIVMNQK
jgi:adenylate cyclase